MKKIREKDKEFIEYLRLYDFELEDLSETYGVFNKGEAEIVYHIFVNNNRRELITIIEVPPDGSLLYSTMLEIKNSEIPPLQRGDLIIGEDLGVLSDYIDTTRDKFGKLTQEYFVKNRDKDLDDLINGEI